jgi:hypothetical protein
MPPEGENNNEHIKKIVILKNILPMKVFGKRESFDTFMESFSFCFYLYIAYLDHQASPLLFLVPDSSAGKGSVNIYTAP